VNAGTWKRRLLIIGLLGFAAIALEQINRQSISISFLIFEANERSFCELLAFNSLSSTRAEVLMTNRGYERIPQELASSRVIFVRRVPASMWYNIFPLMRLDYISRVQFKIERGNVSDCNVRVEQAPWGL